MVLSTCSQPHAHRRRVTTHARIQAHSPFHTLRHAIPQTIDSPEYSRPTHPLLLKIIKPPAKRARSFPIRPVHRSGRSRGRSPTRVRYIKTLRAPPQPAYPTMLTAPYLLLLAAAVAASSPTHDVAAQFQAAGIVPDILSRFAPSALAFLTFPFNNGSSLTLPSAGTRLGRDGTVPPSPGLTNPPHRKKN